MNLDKQTRKKLYEAKGPLWIEWPEGIDPRPGKRYAVHSEEDGSKLFSVRVEKTRERGEEARVKIDNDPVRVLPGLQGSRKEDGSYETEPERVSADYENEQAAIAGLRNIRQYEARTSERRAAAKEASIATSSRSERAKARHRRSLESTSEAACENGGGPARPANSGD